jgi:Ca2+-binding RTX toxin-like protein
MTEVRLESVFIGRTGEVDIYRVDLAQSGLSSIGSITIADDNVLSGGTGSTSGLDLDFVTLLNAMTVDPAAVMSGIGDPVFDFSGGGVVFQPGFQRPLTTRDPVDWNSSLQGTSGANIYDSAKATLDIADSNELSLGESGQVTFVLKSPLSTSGRYFYFGDTGSPDRASYVVVSDAGTVTPTDFTLVGTAGSDSIILGVGLNTHLQFTDTTVFGREGDDTIYGAFGNDKLHGEAGKDWLSGGAGNDWLWGSTGNDKLFGDDGRDIINGGHGNDKLLGGKGRDAFVFDSKLGTAKTDRKVNFDRITDFNVKNDSVWLDNAIFKKLGSGSLANQKLLKKAYFALDHADDANDYIIYKKKSGILAYDSDGSGSKAEVEFAQLSRGLKMTYRDFFII